MSGYHESLIYTESEDGLDLAGIVIRPNTLKSNTAILWFHGNTGNFYDYPYIMIGRTLASLGYLFISANTRGHDVTSFLFNVLEGKRVAGGSAWERLEDAPYDITGWINAAQEQGAERVVLVGHSQGASKVVCYQALRNDPRVQGVVLASPDLHGHWSAELVAEAYQRIHDGQEDDLLPPMMNTPAYRLSAANIVSRDTMLKATYSGDDPYLTRVQCPLLVFFGSRGDVGGVTELETIKSLIKQSTVTTAMIDKADHLYFDQHDAVATLLIEWL